MLDILPETPGPLISDVRQNGAGPVARTWSLTTTAITERSPLAMRLLQIMSCLAADQLPRDVLLGATDQDQIDTALGILASYNMITLTANTVSVHRLVQAVTAHELQHPTTRVSPSETTAPNEWGRTLRETTRLLLDALPADLTGTTLADWPRWIAVTPHVTALAKLCPDEIGGLELSRLLVVTAWFETSQGRYEKALARHRRGLAIAEASVTIDHPQLITPLIGLALDLTNMGHPDQSEPLYRRALSIALSGHGEQHQEVAKCLNALGVCLMDQGRYEEAEPLLHQSASIYEATNRLDSRNNAGTLDSLGVCLTALGRPEEAEPLLRRALTILENFYGPDHPDLAIVLDSLADFLRKQGRATEAEPLNRRAVAITEATLAPTHPDIARRLNNLGRTLQELNQPDEAEPLHRRAATIAEYTLGATHPLTRECLTDHATTVRTRSPTDEPA